MSLQDYVNAFENAKKNREHAEEWMSLLDKRERMGGCFKASACHFKIGLTICGQEYEGSKNYHESPEPFNRALADVIHRELRSIGARVIEELKKKEAEAARNAEAAALDVARECRAALGPV